METKPPSSSSSSPSLTPTPSSSPKPPRPTWKNHWHFLFSLLGFSVNLHCVWTFPYLMYSNGGAAFLIPYLGVTLLVAIPLQFLELFIGQYSGFGPRGIWNCLPIASGIGTVFKCLCVCFSLKSNFVLAFSLLFLFSSFKSPLPWSHCGNAWNDAACFEFRSGDTHRLWVNDTTGVLGECDSVDPESHPGCHHVFSRMKFRFEDAAGNVNLPGEFCMDEPEFCPNDSIKFCRPETPSNVTCICSGWSQPSQCVTRQSLVNVTQASPTEQFWTKFLMRLKFSLDEGDTPRWHLAVCFLIGWHLVALLLLRGIRASPWLTIFRTTFPYVVALVLMAACLARPGASNGIRHLFEADIKKAFDPRTWYVAVMYVFITYSISQGGLVMIGSYNPWNADFITASYFAVACNVFFSIVSAIAVFGAVGTLAHDYQVPVEYFATSGPDVAFVVLAEIVAKLPAPNLFAVVLYVTIFFMALNVEVILVLALIEHFQRTKIEFLYLTSMLVIILTSFYLMGFHMITDFVGTLIRYAVVFLVMSIDLVPYLPVTCVAFLHTFTLMTCYAFRYLHTDVKAMIFAMRRPRLPLAKNIEWLWRQTMVTVTYGGSVTSLVLLFFSLTGIIAYQPSRRALSTLSLYYILPYWLDEVGWILFIVLVFVLPILGAVSSFSSVIGTKNQKLKQIAYPTAEWCATDEELDAQIRKELGIPIRVKPKPVVEKKPWEDGEEDEEEEEEGNLIIQMMKNFVNQLSFVKKMRRRLRGKKEDEREEGDEGEEEDEADASMADDEASVDEADERKKRSEVRIRSRDPKSDEAESSV